MIPILGPGCDYQIYETMVWKKTCYLRVIEFRGGRRVDGLDYCSMRWAFTWDTREIAIPEGRGSESELFVP